MIDSYLTSRFLISASALVILLFGVACAERKNNSNNNNNVTGITDIPLAHILRDLASLSKPGKSDLEEASKADLKRALVGVKKRKNYEILLYEYSDDEDPPVKEADFGTDQNEPEDTTTVKGDSERRQRPESVNEEDTVENTHQNFKDRFQTNNSSVGILFRKNETSEQVIDTVKTPLVVPRDEGELPDYRVRVNKATSRRLPNTFGFTSDSTAENDDRKSVNEGQEDTPFTWNFKPQTTNVPRNRGNRLQHTILLKPRPEQDRSSTAFTPTEEEEDDDPNLYSTSVKPERLQPVYKKPDGVSSTIRPPYRQSIEDAPGAGRFIPRRRPDEEEGRVRPALNISQVPSQYEIDDANSDAGDDFADKDKGNFCKDPTGKTGVCQEYFKCSVLYATNAGRINLQDYKCSLGNEVGICCPLFEERNTQGQQGRTTLSRMEGRMQKHPLSRQIRRLIRSKVNNSIAFGSDSAAQWNEIETDLFTRGGQVLTSDNPAFGHNRFFPSSKKIRQVSEFGFELLQTTNDLSERFHLTNELGGSGLKTFTSSNTRAINDRCPRLPPCGINKYRLIDGSCNNLRRQKMGQSLTPLSRVLEPAYADGRWEPRVSVRGFLLPSARMLSQRFVKDRDNPNNKYTLLVMQFGQFVDHDISSVPIFKFENGSGISCCRNGNFLPPQDRHPNCLPIEIPAEDPFYNRFDQRCMNFVRSRMAPRIDCSLGYADQMNAVTHWLDLSNVYGSTEVEGRELRLFEGGLLRFSELADRRMLLPLKRRNNGEVDYRAGDERVNEMQGLMVMHLIWMREHNRVALELQNVNPFWNDEQLFQEARRIVIAQYQHIIYNEWLPIIVGPEYMQSYGILPLRGGTFFQGYDPEIDASVENSFSSAGFRMGHTLVQGIVRLINEFGQSSEAVAISNHADNAVRTRAPNQIDRWIRGLAQQPIQSFDPFVTQHLNGRLFQARGGLFGMDLTALNIQRARDHGIAGYNAYRELCQTGSKARSFDDFKDWIPAPIVDEMKRLYDHPDDVDLFIGGISEAPLKGALLGPTFTCIVGDQFARTKKGDRYFYDVGDQTHSFSPGQLQELRKSSIAAIMCDNSDELEAIQPSALLVSDFDFNALVDCRSSRRIPRVNLRLWESEPTP